MLFYVNDVGVRSSGTVQTLQDKFFHSFWQNKTYNKTVLSEGLSKIMLLFLKQALPLPLYNKLFFFYTNTFTKLLTHSFIHTVSRFEDDHTPTAPPSCHTFNEL